MEIDPRTARFRLAALPVAAIVLCSAGCAPYRTGAAEVSAVLQSHAATAAEAARAYADAPPSPDVGADRASTPNGHKPLEDLRDFIVLALERSPEIRAAEETARAKVERIRQVTSLGDPMVSAKVLPEPVRTAEGDNYFVLGISQKLPIPEKLDRAGRVALEETRMALRAWEAARLRVVADVKRAYFQLYVVDRSSAATLANQELLRNLIDVARAQVAAGRRSQDDVLRAQVELSNLEAELIALAQHRHSLAARLNQLLDRDPRTPIDPPSDFGIRDIELTLSELLDRAAAASPDLARLKHQIDRDGERVRLAELAGWPDFTLGLEWMYMEPRDAFLAPRNPRTGQRPPTSTMSEDGTDNWAIMLGFNLPIWSDRIRGGIEEARRTLASSREQYRSAMNHVEFAVEDALERVRSQQRLARLFVDTIIPQAEQTYHVSQASYSAGTTDFLDVIDNWRKWLVFTIQYYRTLGELERSVADLEQAIGLSLREAGDS